MEPNELISKLRQIEEHAKDTLADLPSLTKQRLKMIIALASYLRTEISLSTSRASANDDDRLSDSA
jgi:hypothetical protein